MKRSKFGGDYGKCSQLIRQALATTPVNVARTPKWVLDAVKAAIKSKRLPDPRRPLMSAGEALEYATSHLGEAWVDHFGSLKYDGYDLLVSEPYASKITGQMLQDLEAFTDLVGGAYYFSAHSGHYPSRTVRIVVSNNKHVVERYKVSEYVQAMQRTGLADPLHDLVEAV
jgi:hypothetical protein